MKQKKERQKEQIEFMKKKSLKLEDVLFFGLIIFSLTFCGLVYGIGEKIRDSVPDIVAQIIPSPMERKVNKMISSYPMKEMSTYIAKENKNVAAFLVAIAKKESNWGRYSPKKLGKECYNYWGYRGTYNQTVSGYSCFNSPEQAVGVVGDRIEDLIGQQIDTPKEMIVWKCGSSCAGHGTYSVNKWIQDVDLYYKKLYN